MTNQNQLSNHVHLQGNIKGKVFLPLCAKPSFLAMLDMYPNLLDDNIKHCMNTTEEEILIFIADGAVMEEAIMALGTSRARAQRITSSVSEEIRLKVDKALEKLEGCPNNHRIKGVVHWKDIESNIRFQKAFKAMEEIMFLNIDPEDEALSGLAQTQYHIKTLVNNLFTQRVEKARKAGSNISNVFVGDSLELKQGTKYMKRYRHLERACLLEVGMILVGADHKEQVFTEMRYLTNDPQGMTFIAACLQGVRNSIPSIPDESNQMKFLKEVSAVSHGITFVKTIKEEYNKEVCAAIVKASNSGKNNRISHFEPTNDHKSVSMSAAA